MADTLMVYTRGTETVRSIYTPKDPKTGKDLPAAYAHAVVGTLLVGGIEFDTFERLDGRVCLPKDRQLACTMETAVNFKMNLSYDGKTPHWVPRKQIRPKSHGASSGPSRAAGLAEAPILLHPGSEAHHFEGCIGLGVKVGRFLTESAWCMMAVLDLCGGYADKKVVQLIVKGDVPATPREAKPPP